MHWYDDEINALVARIENGEIQKGSNLFYGSSSFRLWEQLKDDFSPYHVENVAFGGSTLEACVHFFDRLVVPCEPATLFCYAGDNDLGDGKYYLDILGFFESLLHKRAETLPEVPLYFLSIKPSPARRDLIPKMRLINDYIRKRLEEIPNSTYIDIHTRMLDKSGMPDGYFFSDDKLHMNETGYALWRQILLEHAECRFR